MKISLVAPYLSYGGAEKQFCKLVEILAGEKCELRLYVLSSNAKCVEKGKEFTARGICVKHFNIDAISSNKLSVLLTALKVLLLVKKGKPDFTYFYTLYLMPLCLLKLVSASKIIYSERILSPQTISRKPIYKLMSVFVDSFVVNGESLYEFFKIIKSNTFLIHNFVEPIRYESNLTSKKVKKIGLVARVSSEKNTILAIQAIEGTNLTLNLYYTAVDDLYFDFLKTEINRRGLEHRVFFKGSKSIESIYEDVDLIVHPSKFEGTPNVVLEAMASFIPCLCSNIRECKDTGIANSFIFEVDSCQSLSNKIKWWDNQPLDRKQELLLKNKINVEKKYSIDVFSQKILKLFNIEF